MGPIPPNRAGGEPAQRSKAGIGRPRRADPGRLGAGRAALAHHVPVRGVPCPPHSRAKRYGYAW